MNSVEPWTVQVDGNNITAVTRTGRLGLTVIPTPAKAVSVAVDRSRIPAESLRGVSGIAGQSGALRGALALAHAGPRLAALMGGWIPIKDESVESNTAKMALRDRLIETIGKYAPKAFTRAFEEASAAIPTELANLRELFNALRDAAIVDAQRLAKELVPQKHPQADEAPTQDAQPLTFVVDQLQDFDEMVDLWTRLAGIGILIGRQGGSKDRKDQWWSLNLASLHVSRKNTVGVREPLNKDNAVAVNGESDWPQNARVDPVPLVVGEISGVRGAVVRYESQSIVAEMEGRPQLDRRGQAREVARRPEAYLFPVGLGTESFRLPPLTFGRGYDIVPYLIGHGGALPPALRNKTKIEDPTSGILSADPNGAITIPRERFVTLDGGDVIRSKASYLRTVPVGAPRMSPKSVWPGLIEDVAPLAAELPTRPPPITLHDKRPVRFFLDKEHTRGTLNSLPDVLATDDTVVEATGIRIEIEGIDVTRQWSDLVIRVETVDPAAQDAKLLLEVKVTRTEIAALFATDVGLRIDVMGNIPVIAALRSRAGDFAEDEPEGKKFVPATSPKVEEPVSAWQSFWLVVEARGADFDVEPASIRWGALAAGGFLLHGDRSIFPPELVASSRDIALLDGIGPVKRPLGPHKASIKLRRPATTLATYDRWVNGPLSDYGDTTDSTKDTVRKALNAAATRTTTNLEKGTDRTLDDPAVQALVFEVVRLFPQRQVDQTLVVLDKLSGLNAILGGTDGSLHGADISTIHIELDASKLGPATWKDGKLKLTAGCVYELRIYGAVPLEQPSFAPAGMTTRSRFAPAAIAGWREAEINGTRWHLGAPLILTVEVASEIMPELYLEAGPDKPDESAPAVVFSMSLRRPPRVLHERAAMYLQPYRVGLPDPSVAATSDALVKYAALRHVDRLALFEQRWSWRGRPQAEIPAGEIKTSDVDVFVGTAFLGRSDDDIGTIHEMRITRAHAYGKRATFAGSLPPFSIPIDDLPVVLERHLDYRGGANLWRFAVRARSRYAAMRPNDPLLIRFSHRKDNKAKTLWSTFIVPDRAKPGADQRKPMRPGLMLVVPLTEPMMTGGSVPPLLALFNEPMFPLFHAGDGIKAVIEVARHPFVGAEPSPASDAAGSGGATPKYWPEYGPDPIRTGKGASGEPLALRCDGPVGYTFDIDTEAGYFDHAGLLVSPVIDTVRPWSLVKLRFRRLEAPEFLVDLGGKILVKTLSPPTDVNNPVRYRLSSDVPEAPKDDSLFATVHEGLVFEVDDLEDPLRLRLSFDDPKEITRDGKVVVAHYVRIVASIDRADPARPRLVLEASTQLGRAADWAINYDTGGKVQVRVVVSQRPRPGDDPYRPSGDVSVRVRIMHDATDVLQRAHENAWLSVICMPLTARDVAPPASGLLSVSSPEGPSMVVRVRPVRLSDFTPGVWCQFAAAMSRIVVEVELRTTGAPRCIKDTLTVTQLTAEKEDDRALRIGVSGLRNGEKISKIAFTAVGEPDRHDPGAGRYGAQVEEQLYALVTRYVYDAFDRLRERPVAMYRLADTLSSPVLRETTWQEGLPVESYATGSGRVRILRVLCGRTRDQQGFEVTAKEFPRNFFGDAVESGGISDEPVDSAGQVIGISVPFEWTSDSTMPSCEM